MLLLYYSRAKDFKMSDDKYLVVPRVTTYSKQLAVANASGGVITLDDSPELIFTVRKEQNVTVVPCLKKTVTAGSIVIDDQALGLATVTIDAADTLGLDLGTYLWELKYISGDAATELITNSGLLYLTTHLYSDVS